MTTLPTPKLIIFDCDGTLVDTETVWADTMEEVFSQFGPPFSATEAGQLYSAKSAPWVVEDYSRTRNVILPDNALDLLCEVMDRRTLERGDAVSVKGALDCMKLCAGRIPIAVATNGEVGVTRTKLKVLGLLDALPDVKFFTKDIVKNPKPAPDLFLHVAELYGVEPIDTWVIEDSVTGVTAGVAAGMTVIGFVGTAHDKTETAHALEKAGAVLVFDDYGAFPAF